MHRAWRHGKREAEQAGRPRFYFGFSWTEDSGAYGVHVCEREKDEIFLSLATFPSAAKPQDVPEFMYVLRALNGYKEE